MKITELFGISLRLSKHIQFNKMLQVGITQKGETNIRLALVCTIMH